MKIALISPEFPPHPGGVSDHTFLLAEELTSQDHQVVVCTSQSADAPFEMITEPMPWSFRGLANLARKLRASKMGRPDRVILQYVPYMYAPKLYGIHPLLAPWIFFLKKSLGCPVGVYVHELNYPVGLSLDRLAIGVPQWIQFLAIAQICDFGFFTTEIPLIKFRSQLLTKSKERRFSWLPIPATIMPLKKERHREAVLKTEKILPKNKKILLQFGGTHPTILFEHSFEALKAAKKEFGEGSVKLVFIGGGMDDTQIEKLLTKVGHPDLKSDVLALGYLNSEFVSAWISRASLVLAPFLDGVSTRRTSVMSALAHGKAVVTTQSYWTDPGAGWEKICACVDAGDRDAYARKVVELLQSPEVAELMGQAALAKYESEFSIHVTTAKLIERLEKLSS